jgi:hypothetical protein
LHSILIEGLEINQLCLYPNPGAFSRIMKNDAGEAAAFRSGSFSGNEAAASM